MFGYVKPVIPELRVREADFYRVLYCGVCRAARKTTGLFSSFFLTYDSVTLLMIRLLCGERTVKLKKRRCIAHPFRRHAEAETTKAFTDTARLSALLLAAKNRDDKEDERGAKRLRAKLLSPLLRRMEKRADLMELQAELAEILSDLREREEKNERSVDIPAALSGKLLGKIFAYGIEEKAAEDFGDLLGRVVYKLDAFDDYKDDVKENRYNPFRALYGDSMTPDNIRSAVTGIRLDCESLAETLDRLPLHKDGDTDDTSEIEAILRNILYLGLDPMNPRKAKKGHKDERSL